MSLSSLRPFALFLVGFLTCLGLVSAGDAQEKDAVKELRATLVKVTKQALEVQQLRMKSGAGSQAELASWTRRHIDARLQAGELSPVEAATANLKLAKEAEKNAAKLQRFGQLSEGDVIQARYFRVQAELELALAKRKAK
jgi:hypothetical protein